MEELFKLLGVTSLNESQQEEVKSKIQDIIDIKVNEKVSEAVEEEKQNLLQLYESKFEDYKEDITSKFSTFVDTVLDEELTIPENIVEYARKGELYSDLIEQFKVRLGIDEDAINEEVKDLLREAKDEILNLRQEINDITSENVQLKEDAKDFALNLYLQKKCRGLSESQRSKVMNIIGDAKSVAEINRKYDIVFESILKEEDEDKTSCVCPDCGKMYTVEGACSLSKCEECGVALKDSEDSDGKGVAEIKESKINESNDEVFKNYLRILREGKF